MVWIVGVSSSPSGGLKNERNAEKHGKPEKGHSSRGFIGKLPLDERGIRSMGNLEKSLNNRKGKEISREKRGHRRLESGRM